MSDDRTPVVIGVGSVVQREADPSAAVEPVALMAQALEAAAADAGSREWLETADALAIPRGFWDYPDPGRWVAETIGAKQARTQFAQVGVLQTTLFAKACTAIAAGEREVVLVAGGEAKWRAAQAARAGVEAPVTDQGDVSPDEVWTPAAEIIHPAELAAHLGMPVRQYAVIENALRAHEGLSLSAHRDEVAEVWSGMSRASVENPDAWTREFFPPEAIRDAAAGNRMLAFPYTKRHNSQWNVDQAAGLVFTSVARARAAGVSESQWVYPRAIAESNFMLPLAERAALHRCVGFAVAGETALAAAGLGIDEIAHRELYSCFPAAVRVQQRELGLDLTAPVTLGGGMAFAGGPLNSFVLQAAVRMAQTLRTSGGHGLLTAVSGMLTKQGVSVWSTTPGPGFSADDVSTEVERQTERRTVVADYQGPATVAGHTVVFEGDQPSHTLVIADTPSGERAVGFQAGGALAERAQREELAGVPVSFGPEGVAAG
ncbi:MAG: acetyl-CoA acetyltransferase [Myxococcota bacterium]